MRPRELRISPYIAADADVVAVSSTPAAGGIQALTLVSDPVTLDIPRQIAITSVGDDTGRTFSIRGTDSKGNQIIEAVAGANAGAASTVRSFATVDQVLVDDDTAGAVEVGTAGTAVSTNWLPLDYLQENFQVGLALNIPVGTLTPDFTVELTLSNLLDYQGANPVPGRGQAVAGIGGQGQFSRSLAFIVPVAHDTLVNVTAVAVTSGNIAFPVRAVRLLSNTLFTVNDVSLEVVQSHHGP